MSVTRAADPRLGAVVSRLGHHRGTYEHGRELALPTGGVQLLISLSTNRLQAFDVDDPSRATSVGGAALQGPTDQPRLIDPADQREIIWVAFRPGGARPFFSVDSVDIRDRLVGLDDLWGPSGARLREELLGAANPDAALQLVERALLDHAARPPELDPAVRAAVAELHRGAAVGTVADRLGWTPRRLNRQFTAQIGLPPKRFSRVRRFQRLLHAATGAPGDNAAISSGAAAGGDAAEPDWARLAVDCGYYDQAHLINDFRALSGLTPGAYRPRRPGEPNHVPHASGQ